jgi:hypothetical protein
MPHLEHLELDASLLAKLETFAAKREVAPEAVASEAIAEGLAAMEERLFWEERRKGADIARGLEILRNAGKGNPPDPGDELPEDLQYLLTERGR